MITLPDPETIPHTHRAFKTWMVGAGYKLEELDEKEYDIQTQYWIDGNDHIASCRREQSLFDLKFDLIKLKLEIQATMALWKQLRDEMPIAGAVC